MDNRMQRRMEIQEIQGKKTNKPDTEQLTEFYLNRTRPDICICCVM